MVMTSTEPHYRFPPLPYAEWEATKNTLHLFVQIVGKIRLTYHPKLNHWWHAALYPSARGFTTGCIPYGDRDFEIEFDFIDHELQLRSSDGELRSFPLSGLTVAEFYRRTMDSMASLGMPVHIYDHPYLHPDSDIPFHEDNRHQSYEPEAVHRFWLIVSRVANIFEEFRGEFTGKSTPVHLFWHSFDLALTRFSGRKAPSREGGTSVDREAYSHEVISFGFWAGDPNYPQPAFYSYTYPAPEGLTQEPLMPGIAFWGQYRGSDMALMNYEDFRRQPDPHQALLDFLRSAYWAGAKRAHWPVEEFHLA